MQKEMQKQEEQDKAKKQSRNQRRVRASKHNLTVTKTTNHQGESVPSW